MGSFTDTMENEILDHVVNNATWTQPAVVYSALFTVIPSDSTAGTEVTQASSGYTRVATTFGVAASGSVTNSGAVNFATVAAGATLTIVGWGLISTATFAAGTLIFWATVTSTALNVGDQATFPVGNIVITLD